LYKIAPEVMNESQRPRDQIQVWSWNLDTEDPSGESDYALLSEDEKARGRRFASPRLQRRFAAGRARLRSLLGEYLNRDPRALVFVQNEFGKPSLIDDPSVHFSLSHTEDRAILAVSETLVVGADIEHVRVLDHLDLARRYFHPNEAAAIESLRHPDEQRQAFFRTWTLKEAIVKALGKGLSIPLESFEVSIATSPPSLVLCPEGAAHAWWLHLVPGDYCLALAAPAGSDVGLIQRTV
jgi:4'-phosphopantetheinyl transferase